jgi:hypothetical protein
LVTVKDENYIPISNAIVAVERQYLSAGQFYEVERVRTDTDGRTIAHLVLSSEVYNFAIYKDGILVGRYNNVNVFCATAECKLNLQTFANTTQITDLLNYRNIIYTSNYSILTRTYSFTYSSKDSTSKTVNVTLTKLDNYGNYTLCSVQVSGASGTLNCAVPSTVNGTAIARITVDGSELYQTMVDLDSNSREAFGIIIAFIFLILISLMGISSGAVMLILFMVGLVIVGGFGFVTLGGFTGAMSAFVWIVVAGLVLLWKVGRSENG